MIRNRIALIMVNNEQERIMCAHSKTLSEHSPAGPRERKYLHSG